MAWQNVAYSQQPNPPDDPQDAHLFELRGFQRRVRVQFNDYREKGEFGYDVALQQGPQGGGLATILGQEDLYVHPVEKAAQPPLDRLKPELIREEYDGGTTEFSWKGVRIPEVAQMGAMFDHTIRNTTGWNDIKNAVNEMARSLYRKSEKGDEAKLRFVKLLGAGGLGFVALFEARNPGDRMMVPMEVDFYAVKGVKRNTVISPHRTDAAAVNQRRIES